MRLLWLTENYPPQRGGMAQSCDRIVNGLRSVGYEIEILHFTNRGKHLKHQKQQNGGYTAINFDDSEPHTLNIGWNYIEQMQQFDYIISFGGYLAMIGAPIYSKWSKTPLVTFLRGNDFDSAVFSPKKRDILKDALESSKMVFSVSSGKVNKVLNWLPGTNTHYVPNGIDISNWQPSVSENEFAAEWRETNLNGKVCLGMIGQLKAKKGIEFFIDCITKTNKTNQIHLLLIGELEEHAIELLQESEFSYTHFDFLDRFELIRYYLCCDAICIPSFYDGMPNVMLETGSLGIPVIASNVDGMADLLEHEKDSLLFQVGNTDECRKVIYKFLSYSTDNRKMLGESLKQKIEKNYTAKHETIKYQNLLT